MDLMRQHLMYPDEIEEPNAESMDDSKELPFCNSEGKKTAWR